LQETYGELLAAYVKGYNGRQVAVTKTKEIAAKPCQALSSIFS